MLTYIMTSLPQLVEHARRMEKGPSATDLGVVEVVVEVYDLWSLFGQSLNIPRDVCDVIETMRRTQIEKDFGTFATSVPFRVVFCTRYIPDKLLRTKRAVINQFRSKSRRQPRIAHTLMYESSDSLAITVEYLHGLLKDQYIRANRKKW